MSTVLLAIIGQLLKMYFLAWLSQYTSPICNGTLVLVICLLLFVRARELRNPLRSVPGPLAARFSRVWMAWHSWTGDMHRVRLSTPTSTSP